jgi:hypothetical protein
VPHLKEKKMKGKKVLFLLGALACCALTVLFVKAAVNTAQKRVAYTITWRAQDHYDDGRVVEAYTETRYVASSGEWRGLRQMANGVSLETFAEPEKGVFVVDHAVKKIWHASPYTVKTPEAGKRYRGKDYVRSELILGYDTDVIKAERAGKKFEFYQAPGLNGDTIKQTERAANFTRIIEPVSITVGEPSSAQMAHADYPRFASAYRNSPQPGGNAQPQNDRPYVRKSMRQVAAERDIELPVPNDATVEFSTLNGLKENAVAVVYGRIVKEEAAFNESGDLITTNYTLNVKRVIRDDRLKYASMTGETDVLPLATPLRFYRAGGEVIVNGHRASQKLEGSELLSQGKDYILFLSWNPYEKSYYLSGVSGAFLVDERNLLKPLGNRAGIRKYEGADLEALIDELINGK